MANFSKEIEFLLKNEIFNSLINSEAVQIAQPGTQRIPKTALLTIFLHHRKV
ncbi:MAG: hypothetical protein ACOY4Q_01730 [Bacillota bacterium]